MLENAIQSFLGLRYESDRKAGSTSCNLISVTKVGTGKAKLVEQAKRIARPSEGKDLWTKYGCTIQWFWEYRIIFNLPPASALIAGNPQTGHDSFNKSAQYRNRVQTCSRGRRNDRERKRTVWKVGNDTVCIWNRPTYLPYRIHQEQDTDGKESGGLQLHGRGTGIDTHEPKYELICSIRFEESTVYGAKHRTY